MKRTLAALLPLLGVCLRAGCAVHTHVIGDGSAAPADSPGADKVKQRQWYALWGLVARNDVQTDQMAGEDADYEIRTEVTFVDGLINAVTSIVTVTTRSVTVTK
ncbi:MAG: hypothetical protein ABGY41_00395 [Candidatus Poribacteria bacterium]